MTKTVAALGAQGAPTPTADHSSSVLHPLPSLEPWVAVPSSEAVTEGGIFPF